MHTTVIHKGMDTVFSEIEKQIGTHGMLLLCHINGQANAAKIGENVAAVRVLEVFRPELAVRVWRAEQQAGIEIPVRLYLYEDHNGDTVVMRRSLREAFVKYSRDELMQVASEADEVIASIVMCTAANV